MSTLHAEPVPASLTVVLGDRRDGTFGGRISYRFKPGETLTVKVDATALVGQWLHSVDNIVASGGLGNTLHITDSDVRDGCALLAVDADDDSTPGDVWTVSFELHPTAETTIVDSVEIEIIGPTA